MASPTMGFIDRDRWLTTGEVRKLLGITRQAIHGLVQRGRLSHQMTPYGRYYLREEVEQLKAAKAKRDNKPTEQNDEAG